MHVHDVGTDRNNAGKQEQQREEAGFPEQQCSDLKLQPLTMPSVKPPLVSSSGDTGDTSGPSLQGITAL